MTHSGAIDRAGGGSRRRLYWFAAALAVMAAAMWPRAAHAIPATVDAVIQYFMNFDEPANPWMYYSTWQSFFQANQSCWGCNLFVAVADTTFSMGAKGSAAFSSNAIAAMSAFMGVWVMFQLYKMLSISHANSPAQSIDQIFNRLVLMMIVTAILKSDPFTQIMVNLVFPTLNGIMDAANSFVGGGQGNCGVAAAPEDFANSGVKLMCSLHQSLEGGVGLGAWLAYSAHMNPFMSPGMQLFQFAGGAVIFMAFCFTVIVIPFRFFDALVRIATVSAILPLVVLAYMFKPTRGVVKTAITSIFAAGLTFLFTAIAIAIAIDIMQAVVVPVVNTMSGDQSAGGGANGPFPTVSLNQFMVLLTTALGIASMILQSGKIANEFAGFTGSMGGAGAAGAAVTGAAMAAGGRFAGAAIGRVGGPAGRLAGRAISEKASIGEKMSESEGDEEA